MLVITSEEIKNVEKISMEEFLIPEELLMERAGISVVQAIWNEFGDFRGKNFVVICGPGNNGGDGYVIARDLLNYTEAVRVVATEKPKSESAKVNYERFIRHGGIVYWYGESEGSLNVINLKDVTTIISSADIVIDAIFGIGLKSPIIDENILRLVEIINIYSKSVVSVDIPSGVNADNGKIMGGAIQANMTVTFGFPKPGHLLFPGRDLTGKLKVAQIGLPSQIFSSSNNFRRFLITSNLVKLPSRPKWAHKKTFGEVLVIGGSKDYLGAPILSALGALKSGAGMVKIITTSEICNIAISHDPSLICHKLDSITLENIKQKVEQSSEKAVIVVGPGWGQDNIPEKLEILEYLVKDIPNTLIIDADGLNIISKRIDILNEKQYGKQIIITPHPGEFSRITNQPNKIVKQNYELAEKFSNEFNVITILKDATTIVTDGKSTYFNTTGNTSLAKAGSGDILSGIIASLISQNLEAIEAAKTAVYILGTSAEGLKVEGANSSFDVIQNLSEVYYNLYNM